MTDAELEEVVASLRRLIGEPFENAWQPDRERVLIGVGRDILLLVPRGRHARVHTVAQRPRNPGRPFSFQGACRAHLHGVLVDLQKHPSDRVVDLHFTRGRLHLRLTGRSGGLWLLEGERVIAAHDGPAPEALPPLPPAGPPGQPPRFGPREGEDWDLAARRWFGEQVEADRQRERRRVLEKSLRTWIARGERLLANLEADLERAAQAPRLRREADTLAAHLHELRRGMSEVVLPDVEEPARQLHIPLDPAVPPVATMERLYAKARRLDRVGDRVIERIDETERRLADLHAAAARLEEAEGEELDRIEALAPPVRQAQANREAPSRPWTTWRGPRGERVLVGRNEKGNRQLTFQVARGDDWWMHLRGRPAAHLILPMERGGTPSLELLLAAAQIALHAAGVPTGTAADLQYTRARNVRSIPGSSGASVLVADERVLRVARDPAGLVGWVREDPG